jgi:hypothetical protein
VLHDVADERGADQAALRPGRRKLERDELYGPPLADLRSSP